MTVSIPEYHYELLKCWGWVKGRSAPTMASDIAQARVEANLEQIKEMLESRAKVLGLSVDELINDIRNDKDE